MLYWIVSNGTVFDIETGLTLNGYVLILNWIIWIRTVWINWIAWNRNFLTIKLSTHAKLNSLKLSWLF